MTPDTRTQPVYVCIPVLRRYDLLQELLESLKTSDVTPAGIYIIDNGPDAQKLEAALLGAPSGVPIHVHTPPVRMGLAEAWNWFLINAPEERVITNDDIRFYPESLGALLAGEGDLVFAQHGYSCFLMRDSCIEKVGFFDETISPGYAYYEDCDYGQRMIAARGLAHQSEINVRLDHGGSQTKATATDAEIQDHHRRFLIARANFQAKWPEVKL